MLLPSAYIPPSSHNNLRPIGLELHSSSQLTNFTETNATPIRQPEYDTTIAPASPVIHPSVAILTDVVFAPQWE